MNKLIAIALVGAVSFAGAAFAETKAEDKADVKASQNAIKKDDAAIAKQESNIEVNRAEKEAAKAEGNVADQASQSVQIGANKTAKAAKEAEKKVDQKILEHDKKKLQEHDAAPAR